MRAEQNLILDYKYVLLSYSKETQMTNLTFMWLDGRSAKPLFSF